MIEIERKFVVSQGKWKPSSQGIKIIQGYLSVNLVSTIRIRIAGEKAFLTIKGKTVGIKRTELEYEIPEKEGYILLKMCQGGLVEKTRYKEKIGNLIWEVDVFEGLNKGLVIAEVELSDENEKVEIPEWVEKEVSDDKRFFNSYLSSKPFSTW